MGIAPKLFLAPGRVGESGASVSGWGCSVVGDFQGHPPNDQHILRTLKRAGCQGFFQR